MDFEEAPPKELERLLEQTEYHDEARILEILRNLGHELRPLALFDSIEPLTRMVSEWEPDVVFNQCEAFKDKREMEFHIAALLELLDIRYTGSGPKALHLCKDKGLAKEIVRSHGIAVPHFMVSPLSRPLERFDGIPFPAFVKPLDLDGSEGIAQASFASGETSALERVKFIHQNWDCAAIIEEYIEGREIYAACLGNENVKIFPPRELFFDTYPAKAPRFATYQGKWNEEYRKKWGIRSGPADSLSKEQRQKIQKTCLTVYRALHLGGFARIDFRLRPNGEIVFLEANPNPCLYKNEDFAQSAAAGDIPYEELIGRIIDLALS